MYSIINSLSNCSSHPSNFSDSKCNKITEVALAILFTLGVSGGVFCAIFFTAHALVPSLATSLAVLVLLGGIDTCIFVCCKRRNNSIQTYRYQPPDNPNPFSQQPQLIQPQIPEQMFSQPIQSSSLVDQPVSLPTHPTEENLSNKNEVIIVTQNNLPSNNANSNIQPSQSVALANPSIVDRSELIIFTSNNPKSAYEPNSAKEKEGKFFEALEDYFIANIEIDIHSHSREYLDIDKRGNANYIKNNFSTHIELKSGRKVYFRQHYFLPSEKLTQFIITYAFNNSGIVLPSKFLIDAALKYVSVANMILEDGKMWKEIIVPIWNLKDLCKNPFFAAKVLLKKELHKDIVDEEVLHKLLSKGFSAICYELEKNESSLNLNNQSLLAAIQLVSKINTTFSYKQFLVCKKLYTLIKDRKELNEAVTPFVLFLAEMCVKGVFKNGKLEIQKTTNLLDEQLSDSPDETFVSAMFETLASLEEDSTFYPEAMMVCGNIISSLSEQPEEAAEYYKKAALAGIEQASILYYSMAYLHASKDAPNSSQFKEVKLIKKDERTQYENLGYQVRNISPLDIQTLPKLSK